MADSPQRWGNCQPFRQQRLKTPGLAIVNVLSCTVHCHLDTANIVMVVTPCTTTQQVPLRCKLQLFPAVIVCFKHFGCQF